MELDRQTIEKKDFPIGRRGYDADAVDAHLAMISGQVDALRRSAQRTQQQPPPQQQPVESLATAAAMQVQVIVEAAESTAADIRRHAQEEAERARHEASEAGRRTREDAVARAQSHVDGVSKAAAVMLQRVAAMESELGALIQSLRTGTDRLNADLALLSTNMGDLYDAAGAPANSGSGGAATSPAPAATGGSGPAPGADAPPASDPAVSSDDSTAMRQRSAPSGGLALEDAVPIGATAGAGAVAATPGVGEPTPIPGFTSQGFGSSGAAAATGAAAGASPDIAGARMIALNMALNGQPREEADRYLADNFDIPNRQALIDEVYSALDG